MIPQVQLKEGWYWPVKDQKCWPWLQREKDLPKTLAAYSPNKRVMIQAGGNCGFYTKAYGEMFQHVYTFEPDPLNFYCLSLNLPEPHIYKQQACLGDKHKLVEITTSKANIGAYSVDVNAKSGFIPTLMIDDLALDICDMIHLDVEGWEFPALKGAIETIKRCKPVIALEWMNHGAKFGFPQEDIERWLKDLGYSRVEVVMNERIFLP